MKKETMTKVVADLNKDNTLYCTECCNTFVQKSDDVWEDTYGRTDKEGNVKRAERVNKNLIQCSCGQNIGFVVSDLALPGEVLAIN